MLPIEGIRIGSVESIQNCDCEKYSRDDDESG